MNQEETKTLSEKEMDAMLFELEHPLRAKVLRFIAYLLVRGVVISLWFIAITAIYAGLRWAIGVWV